jgi:hypothetical protein
MDLFRKLFYQPFVNFSGNYAAATLQGTQRDATVITSGVGVVRWISFNEVRATNSAK